MDGHARRWPLRISQTRDRNQAKSRCPYKDAPCRWISNLVLYVDVSSSMSETEQRLQREGYVNGCSMPQCCSPFESGRRGNAHIDLLRPI
ncbi:MULTISPECIES: DUF1194 domain-containing protein [unclassified Mesorhizobium]|uniref:DUF1194 domain-containing protein n=1 Tax=unclassified Mesorhizobium TaxID=325217 RepID=UPI00333C88C7